MIIIQNILLLVLAVEVFILAKAISNMEKQISNNSIETELYKAMNDIRIDGYDRMGPKNNNVEKESSIVSAIMPKKDNNKFNRVW